MCYNIICIVRKRGLFMCKIGFDNDKYLELQSKHIRERIAKFGGKLYLEFGGKLFDDYHASRVLPGFAPDSKLQMLLQLKEDAEIVIVINAADIEKNKIRGDLGITYDLDVMRLIDAFRSVGLYVGSVVLTRYESQPSAENKKTGPDRIKRSSVHNNAPSECIFSYRFILPHRAKNSKQIPPFLRMTKNAGQWG